MNRSIPGLPVHHQLPEFTQTHVHRVSDTIQPSHPLSSPSPPAPNLSQHQSLFHESTLRMSWPKYWSFSFSIIPSKEIPGPISFRMDWLDLLAVQGTLVGDVENKPLSLSYAGFFFNLFSLFLKLNLLPLLLFSLKSCLILCNPMDYSMPGFPVLHYLLEFAQTHVH